MKIPKHTFEQIGTTKHIALLRGVKQRDLAAAILLCLVLMTVLLKRLEDHQYGINIGGIMHTDEAYADDICIITQTAVQMNTIFEPLDKHKKDKWHKGLEEKI